MSCESCEFRVRQIFVLRALKYSLDLVIVQKKHILYRLLPCIDYMQFPITTMEIVQYTMPHTVVALNNSSSNSNAKEAFVVLSVIVILVVVRVWRFVVVLFA